MLVLADIIEQASGPPHSRRISDMEEEENARNLLKQKIIEGCFRCIDIFCVWNCGFPWSVFKKIVAFIVFDPFMELFITLAIVVNTVFMALGIHTFDFLALYLSSFSDFYPDIIM